MGLTVMLSQLNLKRYCVINIFEPITTSFMVRLRSGVPKANWFTFFGQFTEYISRSGVAAKL